jgi:phage shock protein PspC (stress-responsive transcriptional regulator)
MTMKKIININLSGRVIPIEDTAYEKLQVYIESLRRHFINEEGRDEIINDIESRIAELMSEKIRKGASAISDADVDEIISSMGRPEDFEAEATEETAQSSTSQQENQQSYTYTRRGSKRLYRDTSDKFIGGVCSGLANYLNVDPAIVRILFAIITFGGFGLGFLLYILLWIVLPAKPLEGFVGKRLFRNPDDRIIGGVASGLAAYFKRETWVIRVIFVAPIFLSILTGIIGSATYHNNHHFFPNILFGSLSGTFILAYIVLWGVLPVARSSYEKMEMRGEKVDVNTIRQTVKERAKEFGEEIKSAAQNIHDKAKEFASTRGKEFATEVKDVTRRAGSGLGHAIGVIIKAFFLFIAGTIAFGLFVGLLALIFGGVGLMPFRNFLLNGFWQNTFAWCTLIFFLGIPLIAFITWLIRRMMRVRSQHNYLGWLFGGLWTIGFASATLFAASMANDWRSGKEISEDFTMQQPPAGKMIVKVDEPELRFDGNLWWFNVNSNGWDINDDTLKLSNIRVRISKSDDSLYHVKTWKFSAGENRIDAENRAKKIVYPLSFSDSTLKIGNGYAIDKNSKFRGQRVLVEIEVPVNKKIRFDESVNDKLHPFSVRMYQKHRWNRNWDINWNMDEYFDYDTNVDYIMGKNGELINTVNPEKKVTNEGSDKNERNKRKKELKNELKKIEQQEKQDSVQKKSKGVKQESVDEKDGGAGVTTTFHTTFFSLVKLLN